MADYWPGHFTEHGHHGVSVCQAQSRWLHHLPLHTWQLESYDPQNSRPIKASSFLWHLISHVDSQGIGQTGQSHEHGREKINKVKVGTGPQHSELWNGPSVWKPLLWLDLLWSHFLRTQPDTARPPCANNMGAKSHQPLQRWWLTEASEESL